jgi:hypothetical protein
MKEDKEQFTPDNSKNSDSSRSFSGPDNNLHPDNTTSVNQPDQISEQPIKPPTQTSPTPIGVAVTPDIDTSLNSQVSTAPPLSPTASNPAIASPASTGQVVSNTSIAPEQQQSQNIKRSKTPFIILGIILLLLLGGGGYFVYAKMATKSKNSNSNNTNQVNGTSANTNSAATADLSSYIPTTVKTSDKTHDLYTFDLPKGWIYNPENPDIMIYPTSEDKAKVDAMNNLEKGQLEGASYNKAKWIALTVLNDTVFNEALIDAEVSVSQNSSQETPQKKFNTVVFDRGTYLCYGAVASNIPSRCIVNYSDAPEGTIVLPAADGVTTTSQKSKAVLSVWLVTYDNDAEANYEVFKHIIETTKILYFEEYDVTKEQN